MSVTRQPAHSQPVWPTVGGLMPVAMAETYFDLAVTAVQVQRSVVVQLARVTTAVSAWPTRPLRSAARLVRKAPVAETFPPVVEIGRPYQHWSKAELQDELLIRGLSPHGTTEQLRERVFADDVR